MIMSVFIGLWLAFTFEYIIRRPLMEHVMKLNMKNLEGFLPLTDYIIFATILMIAIFAFELIYYWVAMKVPYMG